MSSQWLHLKNKILSFSRNGLALLACAWVLWAQVSIGAEKSLIKITYVTTSLSMYKGSNSGDLNSISFSIQNLTDQPLEWVKIRAVFRSNAGELIQTETFEEDLSGTGAINKPLGPKEARQLTHYVTINGFVTGGKHGFVDVSVIDFRLGNIEGRKALEEGVR